MATKMVARIAVAVLGIAGVLMHAPGAAYAAEVKKVTIVLSTTDQDVSYQPYGPFAQQMGWYKDEGLDVTIQTASNSGQVIQLLLTGQAQFGMLSPESILLAAGKQALPVKFIYPIIRKTIYTAALKPDSTIKNFGDLKGKVIGFPSSSTNMTIFAMHDWPSTVCLPMT